jgi:hypothetical protein
MPTPWKKEKYFKFRPSVPVCALIPPFFRILTLWRILIVPAWNLCGMVKKKLKQARYRPGVAQRVPGS